ncbi:hypothetical protein ACFPL7_00515 [Dongia soli]|uniref:hypothetical protein n=1 Tax=Dongia soli TaxID=600628 RepID=UPI0036112515
MLILKLATGCDEQIAFAVAEFRQVGDMLSDQIRFVEILADADRIFDMFDALARRITDLQGHNGNADLAADFRALALDAGRRCRCLLPARGNRVHTLGQSPWDGKGRFGLALPQ